MDSIPNQLVKDQKTDALIAVLAEQIPHRPRDILVVGCGTGLEAGRLARVFETNSTIGIDLGQEFNFDHVGAAPAKLMPMNAEKLEFPSNSFDLIYCFHALEHISDPRLALREMARVLRPGGSFMLGTPNKSRLVGYVGSAHSLWTKLRWNMTDLSMRLRGKWSNEAGAHAGFTEKELQDLCHEAFGVGEPMSDRYYERLYRSHRAAVQALTVSGMKRFLFPCVYIVGTKA